MQKLVVFTGYGGTGKSTLSEYLGKESGFTRISSEDLLREGVKPKDVWDPMCERRDYALKNGSDVVMDTTSYSNAIRRRLLSTDIPCKKYLIWLKADKEISKSRAEQRPEGWGQLGYIADWEKRWEDPEPGKDYIFIEYQSDTQQDLEFIKSDLKKILA